MNISDETLMAYVDGELAPAARQEVESAMREDPQTEKRVARHQALRQRVQAAYSAELTEQVPEYLLAVANGAMRSPRANVVNMQDGRAGIDRNGPRMRRLQWRTAGTLAASIIVGAGFGFLIWGRTVSPLTLSASGTLVAHGQLGKALSEQLAAERPPGSGVQIGLSFLAKSGDYCRTFALLGAASWSGLACRHGPQWQVQVLSQIAGTEESAAAEYRTAGSAMSAPILQAVESEIAGEPLDPASENEARRRAWTSVGR